MKLQKIIHGRSTALQDEKIHMHRITTQTLSALALVCILVLPVAGVYAAETPKRGGILTFVVPDDPPSYDGHRERTYGLIHPIAPFYSTLIRVNPENPASPDDFVCDLCTEMPKATNDAKKYTFKLRKNASFWDGQPVTARDVVASFNKIIFPPPDVRSPRKAFYSMVKRLYAPDDYTVVFELKFPTSAFIPALASPWNFIYPKRILDRDLHWFEKNILGSGPFIFVQHQPGTLIEGRRNPNYYHKNKPYLDGFRAIFAKQQSDRVEAIRKGRAMIEFRGFPPRSRDLLKRALGDQITVQESNWNCSLLFVPNHLVKPFDDHRVRQALTLAIDRWGGSKQLSKIAILRSMGGIVFPGHPLAATEEELLKIAGYWPDLEKSRAEARRLLREAGVPAGFAFKLHNRGVDQPYKIAGAWLISQWRSIGLHAEQWVQPSDLYFKTLRSRTPDFQVSIDYNCHSVPNPLLDVSKYISDDCSGDNNANYKDRVLDNLFDRMNRSIDPAEQRRLMRQYEKRILDEQAHMFVILWFYRIIPHRSVVRGWKIGPSHHMNQDLSTLWLTQSSK